MNATSQQEISQALLNHCHQQNVLIQALTRIVGRTTSDLDELKAIDRAVQSLTAAWETLESAVELAD